MNILLPILLFGIAFMIPRDVPTGPAVITGTVPNSPAAEAGFKSGDIIEEINGREVKNSLDAIRITRLNQGENIEFKVKRTDPEEGLQETYPHGALALGPADHHPYSSAGRNRQ